MTEKLSLPRGGYPLLGVAIAIAAVVWFLLFAVIETGPAYWALISAATLVLGIATIIVFRDTLRAPRLAWVRYFLLGLSAAVVLYFLFFLGDILVKALVPLLPTGPDQILRVYDAGAGIPRPLLALLLLLVIGPGEELFWRGFVQRWFTGVWGPWAGFTVTLIFYTCIHLPAMNLPLLGAAFVAGAFWGLLYMRTGHIGPGLISHAIWDVAVFVWFPFI